MAATPKPRRKEMKSIGKMMKEISTQKNQPKGVRDAEKKDLLKSSKKSGATKKEQTHFKRSYSRKK